MPKTVMGLCQPQYWWRMVNLCVCVWLCGDNRKITPATKGCHLADRIVCHLTSPILNHTISTNLPFIILTLAVPQSSLPDSERERERDRENGHHSSPLQRHGQHIVYSPGASDKPTGTSQRGGVSSWLESQSRRTC